MHRKAPDFVTRILVTSAVGLLNYVVEPLSHTKNHKKTKHSHVATTSRPVEGFSREDSISFRMLESAKEMARENWEVEYGTRKRQLSCEDTRMKTVVWHYGMSCLEVGFVAPQVSNSTFIQPRATQRALKFHSAWAQLLPNKENRVSYQ